MFSSFHTRPVRALFISFKKVTYLSMRFFFSMGFGCFCVVLIKRNSSRTLHTHVTAKALWWKLATKKATSKSTSHDRKVKGHNRNAGKAREVLRRQNCKGRTNSKSERNKEREWYVEK